MGQPAIPSTCLRTCTMATPGNLCMHRTKGAKHKVHLYLHKWTHMYKFQVQIYLACYLLPLFINIQLSRRGEFMTTGRLHLEISLVCRAGLVVVLLGVGLTLILTTSQV